MGDLRGTTVLVTGGAQGIGKAVCRLLLERGCGVACADIDGEAGDEVSSEFSGVGSFLFVPVDVADEDSVRTGVKLTLKRFGTLTGLVNNAGVADPGRTPIEELSLDAWNHVIGTNLTGMFLTAKHAAPHLRESRGAIVNVASTRALQSEPHTEAYSASKGGVLALTHALAMSLGPEVRVNCVSPGWIDVGAWKKSSLRKESALSPADHGQHPVGRVGRPEDVASLVAYLVSDSAGFITGQNFVVDGGMTRKMIYLE